jgi:hypothetical protein
MWLTATEIRQKFNISENSFANQITSALLSASVMMKNSVTESAVFDEAAGDLLDEDNANYYRQWSIVQSHAYLTYFFLIKDAGNELGKSGFIKQTATGQSSSFGNVTNQVLTPGEKQSLISQALADAKDFLGDYGVIVIGSEESVSQESRRSTSKKICFGW